MFWPVLMLAALPCAAAEALPGTTLWQVPDDIVSRQFEEIRHYYEQEIRAVARDRHRFWQDTHERNRDAFRKMIGAIDRLESPKPDRELLGHSGAYTLELVSWPILRTGTIGPTMGQAVRAYGILLTPAAAGRFPAVIAIPDATHSAADIAGLTAKLPAESQYARRLALSGYVVFAPRFTQRRTFSQPWINDRSWLNRLAYQTAHHLIGSEVQQVISAADFLSALPAVDPARMGVAGYDQGGLTALYAGALDERLKAVVVAGYFDQREQAFEEPEDRMLWGHLVRFGDAEIGRLVAPRHLIVDAGAGGVRIESERVSRARRESERLAAHYGSLNQPAAFDFVPDPFRGPGFSPRALARLAATLQPSPVRESPSTEVTIDPERLAEVANAQFSQWQARLRNLALESYAARERSWKADTRSLEAYQTWVRPKLEEFQNALGRYPDPSGPFDARSVMVYDEPRFTGYRLSVRLYDGVHAYGILLVPKSMRAGERRPVVFTQHGYGNRPEDALGVKTSKASEEMYNRFGKKLAEKGYVVFAPMIAVQQSEERTRLVRRSHLLAKLPVGLEVRKAGRIIDFLSTLPFVDKDRFAFWGLSYGGYTSLRMGPAEPRFKVVICTANYNDDTLKTTDLTQTTSYLFYPYADPFNFGVLNEFTHSEMAFMVAPRAFMAEVGELDGVVMTPKRFPEIEMQRVEELYRKLGIPEKGRMSRHGGGHIVYGVDAFPFLDRHLNFKPIME